MRDKYFVRRPFGNCVFGIRFSEQMQELFVGFPRRFKADVFLSCQTAFNLKERRVVKDTVHGWRQTVIFGGVVRSRFDSGLLVLQSLGWELEPTRSFRRMTR